LLCKGAATTSSPSLNYLDLTLGLSTPNRDRVLLGASTQPLPFDPLTLAIDPEQFLWGGYQMSIFIPVAEFKLRGLRNRYRASLALLRVLRTCQKALSLAACTVG
jgi:hypothetical protein